MHNIATRLVPVLLALSAGASWAQTKTGTTVGQFMLIEPSARIAAMGNAGTAVLDPIQGVYYNPGALGALEKPAAQFTHSFWLADIRVDYVSLAIPTANAGKFFASVTALNSGDIDVRTVEQPLGTGERFSVSDLALSAAYARDVTHRFTGGVQVNFVQETIWHSSMRTMTFNVGTLYRLTESGIQLGASLTNFGTSGRFSGRDLAIQFDADPGRNGDNGSLPGQQTTDNYPVPVQFRVGLAFPHQLSASSRLLFVVDAQDPSDNSEHLNLGGEWTWKDAFSIRAGYQNLSQHDSELAGTAGIGFRSTLGDRALSVDYAWAYHATLSEMQRLTFVLGL